MILVPVITIDGPSGVGKGTLASRLASHLGWHFLDSGAIYRLLALATIETGVDLNNEDQVQECALKLDARFSPPKIFLCNQDVTEVIRSERCGQVASQIATFSKVRATLLERQRAFRQLPGLVADGRDMGTVVFPNALIKFFLQAGQEERAKRRYHQLKEKGINVSLENLLQELAERDQRDISRVVAPLVPAPDAIIIDSTALSKEAVFSFALEKIKHILPTVVPR